MVDNIHKSLWSPIHEAAQWTPQCRIQVFKQVCYLDCSYHRIKSPMRVMHSLVEEITLLNVVQQLLANVVRVTGQPPPVWQRCIKMHGVWLITKNNKHFIVGAFMHGHSVALSRRPPFSFDPYRGAALFQRCEEHTKKSHFPQIWL